MDEWYRAWRAHERRHPPRALPPLVAGAIAVAGVIVMIALVAWPFF